MRKHTALFVILIAALLLPAELTAQAARASQLAGIGLKGYVEQTTFDSVHVDSAGLFIEGVAVTINATEANILDGATFDVNDLDLLAGVVPGARTDSAAIVVDEDGTIDSLDIDVLSILGVEVTSDANDFNLLDGVVPGARSDSSFLAVDEDGTIDTLDIDVFFLGGTEVTTDAAGLNAIPATTSSVAELNYNDLTGAVGIAEGTKSLVFDASKHIDTLNTAVLAIGASGATTVVTATGAEHNYLDIAALGTGAGSKAVVLNANGSYTWSSGDTLFYEELNDGTTTLTSTALELNRIADLTARVVDEATATLSVTLADHGDRIITLNRAAGITVTLPLATGTGASYTFIIGTSRTSGNYIIQAGDASDVFDGGLAFGVDTDGEGATGYTWYAVAGDDTFTMDGTAQGGMVGDMIKVIDYATDFWYLEAHIQQSGGSEATPFSSAVN